MFRATEQRKILVVDDSEIVLEATRAALESAGYNVVTHDRAAGCVALILQEKPDLVLIDVNLPRVSGDMIASVLGKARPTGDTVVLLHSSLSADILRVKAEAAGAQGFIQKTGDLFALVRDVNRWLKRSANSGQMRAGVEVGAPSSGKLRAAPEFGAASSSKFRVGPDLSRPNGSQLHAAREASLSRDDEARSSDARPSASQLAETAVAHSGTMLRARPPSVLLVDRDMAVLSAYRGYLQGDQLTVEYALSANAALRRILSDEPPDVAVCEAFMNELSGIELYRRALASASSWHQRMILTADVQISTTGSAFAEFKGQLLMKPLSADALRSAVRVCLAQSRAVLPGRAGAT